MLTIFGDRPSSSNEPFCDGVSRRNFLKIGGMALGGLSLPELLLAQGQEGASQPHKAIIMILLPGGPKSTTTRTVPQLTDHSSPSSDASDSPSAPNSPTKRMVVKTYQRPNNTIPPHFYA